MPYRRIESAFSLTPMPRLPRPALARCCLCRVGRDAARRLRRRQRHVRRRGGHAAARARTGTGRDHQSQCLGDGLAAERRADAEPRDPGRCADARHVVGRGRLADERPAPGGAARRKGADLGHDTRRQRAERALLRRLGSEPRPVRRGRPQLHVRCQPARQLLRTGGLPRRRSPDDHRWQRRRHEPGLHAREQQLRAGRERGGRALVRHHGHPARRPADHARRHQPVHRRAVDQPRPVGRAGPVVDDARGL